MAEDSGQERTEQPTARRKQQAREKGQVVNSRELNTMLMMLLSGGAMLVLGPYASEGLSNLFRESLSLSRDHIFDVWAMPRLFRAAILDALWILTPFFVIAIIAALAGPFSMGSVTFSPQALGFKWEKLDPIKGLSRVFGLRGLMELVKALVKFLVIGSVAVLYLYGKVDEYLGLGMEPVIPALGHAGNLLMHGFMVIASALILIAAVDVPFQLWEHSRQLKMTFQEIKDENKDTEGNPDVRGRVRRLQREMAQRRMMAEVPKADVVITNPQHYSVALQYDPDKMGAPRVVAKGTDLIALKIRTIANEHKVPIMQAPPLARALHHTTEIDSEIPAGLYLAVAQVLAYVFQLRRKGKQPAGEPAFVKDLPIPDDMRFDR
jgi:flagellar biosynthetic protein FlhB